MKFSLSTALLTSAALSAPFANGLATDKREWVSSAALQKVITSEGYVQIACIFTESSA